MANTVTLQVKIDDNGDLQLLSSNAQKAAASTDKLAKSQAKAGTGAERHNKQQKGVAGATSNSTKAFSKMTTGITGGLVPAYAVLAANIFAITAAFGALRRAAAFEQLEAGLVRVGNASGANLPFVAQQLKDITGAAVSAEAAAGATALAFSSGFSSAQLEGLTKVAKGASLALGRDMEDALNRLVKGTAKLEPEILDELGIMVRLDDAVSDYAKSINKSDKDLTQFERRQAFLNATIDQGTQKFGDITKAIDPNAYDQLAASFADLTKTALTLVNQALGPLISFLASSPIALQGVLLAFGSTLLNTILPAIGDMSDSHKRSSIQAAIAAKKSSKVITKEYAQASQAAAKGLSLLPKSIQHLAPKIKAGTLNLKEQQQVLKTLTASEKLRAAALNKGLESTRAQRALELQQIRDQIVLTEQLSAAEKTKFKSSEQGKTAKGKSVASGLTARGLKEMEMAEGITKKFGVALKYSKLQLASLGKTSGSVWTKIKVGATVARGAVTLFGTALLNAIPIIGQVLMVASLLWPVFQSIFGKGKMQQELEKITESFKSFADISAQLRETLEGDIDAADAFTARLRVQVGVMNQIISAHQSYIDILRNDRIETIMAKTKELKELQEDDWHWSWTGGFVGGAHDAVNSIINLKGEIEDLKNNLNKLDKESMTIIASEAKAMLEASPDLVGVLGGSLEAYDNLIAEVQGGADISNQEFMKRLREINRESSTTLAAIDGAKQTMGDFTKETINLGSKVSTPFDNLITKSKALGNEYDAAVALGGKGFEAFKKGAVGLQDQLDHIRAKFKLSDIFSDSQVIERMNMELVKVRDTILTSKAEVKKLGNEQKKLNKIVKDSPEGLKESLQLSEDIRLEKLNLLQAELDGLDIIQKTEEQEERILQIKAEQAALGAEQVSVEDRKLQVKVAQVTEDNKILALGDKLMKGAKAELDHELAMLKVAQQIKVAKTGKAITPQEAFKNLKDETALRQTAVALELSMRMTAINMEYELLGAQMALQIQRAKDAGVYNQQTYETIAKLMEAGKNSAIQGAINTANLATKQITADLNTSERSALDSSRTADGTMSERIEAASGSGGAFDPKSTMSNLGDKVSAAVNTMQPMLDIMGPEGALIQSVAAGATASADAWSDAFTIMKDKGIGSLEGMAAGAEAASATIGAIGSILAASSAGRISAIDDEINAEKRRDGQSAASVAKIKKLEAKKEATKKKAFETDKKVKMAQTVMSTAAGIMNWMADKNIPMAVATGIMGAIQLATIASTSYKGGASSAPSGKPEALSMGQRTNTVDLARGNSAGGELAYMRGERGQGTGATNFKPGSAFTGAKYRASGGETAGFMVGEQGPEMFIPDRSGRIAPADETAAMSNVSNVNFNISAVDAAGVEDVLVRQKGHIIRMIREAANEHGQPFLETVSDGAYVE